MCREVKITTGAMLVAALSPRVVLTTMAVAGSGVALILIAGTTLNAYVWMVLVGWAAIATILLLRRRADPRRQAVHVPPPAPRRRVSARVLDARPARALPAAEHDPAELADRAAVQEEC